ncbi:hypothetical protein TNCV_1792391 [Trichonephila clavipes]|nr:hypothetical protein TNCV_1792391 [Trichonephila clavipes]
MRIREKCLCFNNRVVMILNRSKDISRSSSDKKKNGVAAEAVGFRDRSVTLRSSNGEAATEKGVESVEKKLVRDQGGRRVPLL